MFDEQRVPSVFLKINFPNFSQFSGNFPKFFVERLFLEIFGKFKKMEKSRSPEDVQNKHLCSERFTNKPINV